MGDKELREYLEVQGYAEASNWVFNQAYASDIWAEGPLITLTELREIHRRTVEPVWRHFPPVDHDMREGPGSFRRHDIEPFASGMRPPPWPDVAPQVTDWLEDVKRFRRFIAKLLDDPDSLDFSDPAIHPIAQLAALHAALERIHPFRDGNGRAGRLALNLVLVRLNYPPAVIYKKDRAKYLRGLERADKGDPCPLGELFARSVTHGIERFLLPALAGPQRIIPLTALADEDVSLIALRRAAERGRLRAQRRSDQWYSTRKWVDEYKDSRKQGRATQTATDGKPRLARPEQLRLS